MAKALICVRLDREDLQDHICSILKGWKVKAYASMDDVFDHLWEDGGDVDLVVSEPAAAFREELFSAAENWPKLLFLAISDESDRPAEVPNNLIILKRQDMRSEILSRIDRWGKRHGFLYLDRRPTS